ncbi:MAG: hypothetical protein CMM80_03645 [Rhodospirillaceae bacterium]|nr:hypothetical protein [Rhodospirillaceae bacterium]
MRRIISIWTQKTTDKTAERVGWKNYLAFFTFTFLVVSSGAVYLKADQIKDDLALYSFSKGFALQMIEVSGRNHTESAAIRSILTKWRDQSIFSADLAAIRHELLNLGWVKDAVVSRHLPDRLTVKLIERRPVALLQTPAGHQLIDDAGVTISGADVSAFSHLVVVSGTGAAARANALLGMLESEPEIFAEVWAVQLIAERRWDIHMRSGLTIKLPEEDPVLAWSRLAKLERDTAITERDLAAIDLRVPDQLVVEPNIPIRGKGSKT